MEQNYDYFLKTIVIGDASVGKTSIMHRYCDGHIKPAIVGSIAIDYRIKKLTIQNRVIRMHIWDTAGQERFGALMSSYYKRASTAIIMFDITNAKSFLSIDGWLREAAEFAPSIVCKVLVGNKSDLPYSRAVSYEEAYTKAKLNDMQYFETSAKNGENVDQAFDSLFSGFLHSLNLPLIVENDGYIKTITNGKTSNDSSKSYCIL